MSGPPKPNELKAMFLAGGAPPDIVRACLDLLDTGIDEGLNELGGLDAVRVCEGELGREEVGTGEGEVERSEPAPAAKAMVDWAWSVTSAAVGEYSFSPSGAVAATGCVCEKITSVTDAYTTSIPDVPHHHHQSLRSPSSPQRRTLSLPPSVLPVLVVHPPSSKDEHA
jgi:hypothetical protein